MEIARALVLATAPVDEQPWHSVGGLPKPLVRVATRPIVFHVLDSLKAAGVLEAAVVTEPERAEQFRAAIGDGSDWGMAVRYLPADPGSDAWDALRAAHGFAGGEPVLVHRADALLEDRLRGDIVGFARQGIDVLALTVSDPVVGHPAAGAPACWLLSPAAVDGLLAAGNGRDPLPGLQRRGAEVRTQEVRGCLACRGSEEALLRGNRQVLSRLQGDYDGVVPEGSEVQGPAVIHPSAVLQRSLVRGPAIIGPGVRLVDAYVGPYTAVGADARLVGVEIEHSIVMDDAEIMHLGRRLETSIIGRGASVVRRFELPRAVRLSIGDGAAVALS